MSNVTRIVRRNPQNPATLNAPGIKRMRRTGATVYADIAPSGKRAYYVDGMEYDLLYRCAARRKPYRGNSDRMRGAA